MDLADVFVFCVVTFITIATTLGTSQCPPDTARRAQQCFTDLASGVATADDGSNHIRDNTGIIGRDLPQGSRSGDENGGSGGGGGGGIPVDYRRIREYCAPDGHMTSFARCVEELSSMCADLPPEGALKQLINPQRVRTSVPNLCANVDEVEAGAECMKRAMDGDTDCREKAYDLLNNAALAQSPNNSTHMFFTQCRFFSVLAECQRTAVTKQCGGNLGNLHANFLLSFVPSVCLDNTTADLQQGQVQKDDVKPVDSSADLQQGQSQENLVNSTQSHLEIINSTDSNPTQDDLNNVNSTQGYFNDLDSNQSHDLNSGQGQPENTDQTKLSRPDYPFANNVNYEDYHSNNEDELDYNEIGERHYKEEEMPYDRALHTKALERTKLSRQSHAPEEQSAKKKEEPEPTQSETKINDSADRSTRQPLLPESTERKTDSEELALPRQEEAPETFSPPEPANHVTASASRDTTIYQEILRTLAPDDVHRENPKIQRSETSPTTKRPSPPVINDVIKEPTQGRLLPQVVPASSADNSSLPSGQAALSHQGAIISIIFCVVYSLYLLAISCS